MFMVKYLESLEKFREQNNTFFQFCPSTVDKLACGLPVVSVQAHTYSVCVRAIRLTHVMPFWRLEIVKYWQFHMNRPNILSYWDHLLHQPVHFLLISAMEFSMQ